MDVLLVGLFGLALACLLCGLVAMVLVVVLRIGVEILRATLPTLSWTATAIEAWVEKVNARGLGRGRARDVPTR